MRVEREHERAQLPLARFAERRFDHRAMTQVDPVEIADRNEGASPGLFGFEVSRASSHARALTTGPSAVPPIAFGAADFACLSAKGAIFC